MAWYLCCVGKGWGFFCQHASACRPGLPYTVHIFAHASCKPGSTYRCMSIFFAARHLVEMVFWYSQGLNESSFNNAGSLPRLISKSFGIHFLLRNALPCELPVTVSQLCLNGREMAGWSVCCALVLCSVGCELKKRIRFVMRTSKCLAAGKLSSLHHG